eukprot:456222_1
MDDSDASDEDYVPGEEKDEGIEAGEVGTETVGYGIRAHKRAQIDALWDEMNCAEPSKRVGKINEVGHRKKVRHAKSHRAHKLVSSLFGKQTAEKIVLGAERATEMRKGKGGRADGDGPYKLQKKLVGHTLKYAGSEITVKTTKTTMEAEERQQPLLAQKHATGLDAALKTIGGPRTINTVEKSSIDWDQYKDKEGIHEKLKEVTKEGAGYLHKRDFLQRVDEREFEAERQVREAARRKT